MDVIMNFFGPKPMNLLVPAVLFILLAPRFLLAVNDGYMPLIMPMATASTMTIVTHAAIFLVLYRFLRAQFPQYY
jgi:hypothetical protein